ncbi:MAG: Rrf2 family transcriptional regulator [Planctomycetota bacterium]
MELIRRDTDYALRFAAQLVEAYDDGMPLSARVLAKDNYVSYPLTCKILQKLAAAGIVESIMGPKGGFQLAKAPKKIEFRQLIEAVQGPVSVNKCLMGGFKCPLKGKCPAHSKMAGLQSQINGYLKALTLQGFVSGD